MLFGNVVPVYSAASEWIIFFHIHFAFVIQLWISAKLKASSVTVSF